MPIELLVQEVSDTIELLGWENPISNKLTSYLPLARRDQQLRPFALCAGEFIVPDDFDAPLPEEILNEFEGR
ncbi:MAG: type II toxin-antitoxin system Phd/YefM family antitoxin [Fischerella sp. CENA71]|nr:type II toxin-antitoxin system Phd/YefM family antitoxin [Fischerella sp. CENA71]